MRFINNAIVPESTTEINLLEAFNSGIGPFTRELEKLTDQEYVTLLTLLDEYRAPPIVYLQVRLCQGWHPFSYLLSKYYYKVSNND